MELSSRPAVAFSESSITTFDYAPKEKVRSFNKYLKPVMASIVAAMSSMMVGTLNGYTSMAIPNMNENRNPFHVNDDQLSWAGSLPFLAGVPGALISGYIMDRFGRKFILMIAALPFIVGYVIIVAATTVEMLYLGRIVSGFSLGLALSTVGVYISEISPPEIRGILISFHELAVNGGVLLTYVVGAYVPWNWLAVICSAITVIQVILFLFVPESPRWLVMSGQMELAGKTLKWLRGSGVSIEQEIVAIQQSLRETAKPIPWLDYFKPPLLKCFFISQFLFILQQLSGVGIVRSYSDTIFEAAGTDLNTNISTIIVGAVLFFGSCIGTGIIDNFERRSLLLFSSITIGVSMTALGAYFRVNTLDHMFAEHYLSWLPLLSMAVVTIGYDLGCGPLCNVVTSELFATRARGRASSMAVATLCLFGFLTTKLFVNLSDALGEAGAFWFCGGSCFVGAVLIFFLIPKTKGETLESIQQNLGQ